LGETPYSRADLQKNVKDNWDESIFEDVTVETRIENTTMKLHEGKVTFNKQNDYTMQIVFTCLPLLALPVGIVVVRYFVKK
jgi:hypothetical protein